jgi:hypothetical protein
MAIHRVNAAEDGALLPAGGEGHWRAALRARLAGLPRGAPVTVLIHGFRYTWRTGLAPDACPQERLYGSRPVAPCRRRRPERASWCHALGFSEEGAADGLCIGFGWPARIDRAGRRGFAEVYRRAAPAGRGLGRLLSEIAAARPDLRIDMLTHSLGARVAMQAGLAEPGLPLGRLIFLAAAEHAAEAERFLAAMRGAPEVYHLLSRANDPYDALFALVAPTPADGSARPLGRAGLGRGDPRWIDIQLDHRAVRAWLARRGFALARPPERVSHWHFYADRGAMAFYGAILRRARGLSLAELRAAGLPEALEPRWARILPRLPAAAPGATEADLPEAGLTRI